MHDVPSRAMRDVGDLHDADLPGLLTGAGDQAIARRLHRINQYWKLGRALRTETVIGDTHDFGIGRRVCAPNWVALRGVGDTANRRLCDAEAQTARPTPDVVTLTHVTRPSTTNDGLHAPALCFGDPRVHAQLHAA